MIDYTEIINLINWGNFIYNKYYIVKLCSGLF